MEALGKKQATVRPAQLLWLIRRAREADSAYRRGQESMRGRAMRCCEDDREGLRINALPLEDMP